MQFLLHFTSQFLDFFCQQKFQQIFWYILQSFENAHQKFREIRELNLKNAQMNLERTRLATRKVLPNFFENPAISRDLQE